MVQIREGLKSAGLQKDAQLIESTDREVTRQFMRLNDYLDGADPKRQRRTDPFRGGEQYRSVIETGTGNCHIFVG